MTVGIIEDYGCKHMCPYLTSGIRCTRENKAECNYRKLFSRLNSTKAQEDLGSLLTEDALIAALRAKGYSGELKKTQVVRI